LVSAGVLLICGVVTSWIVWQENGSLGRWGLVVFAVLALKFILAALHRDPPPEHHSRNTVAVVVPIYNEDLELFKNCLASIVDQTVPADQIWVVDDGSPDLSCYRFACDVARECPTVRAYRYGDNRGKRHAMGFAMARTAADLLVTVDSDTVLARDGLERITARLEDKAVMGVTSEVRALNSRRNLLTKLISIRYANAFLWERAAYSTLGSVLCCCGSFSAYRGWVIRRHLADFVNQRFLGVQVQYGDDRRLTNYALLHGRVEIEISAVAWTAVPERLTHFLRQQARWNRSFFRETLWALRNQSRQRAGWWLAALELTTWVLGSIALVGAVVLRPALTGETAFTLWLSYVAVMAFARSAWALQAESIPLLVWLLSPLYGVMHLLLLMPVRVWSLATLRKSGWGTRAEVEVAA
jgi:hyaluronan synthase